MSVDQTPNKSTLPGRNNFAKNQIVAMITGLAAYANQIPELQQSLVNWDMVSMPRNVDLNTGLQSVAEEVDKEIVDLKQ